MEGVKVWRGVLQDSAITGDGEEVVRYLHGDEVGGKAAAKAEGVDVLAVGGGCVAPECESGGVALRGGEEGVGGGGDEQASHIFWR